MKEAFVPLLTGGGRCLGPGGGCEVPVCVDSQNSPLDSTLNHEEKWHQGKQLFSQVQEGLRDEVGRGWRGWIGKQF